MPQLQPGLPPPPDYYARNLRFLFREVCRRSGALLTPPERAMVTAYLAETPGAQRLFARLASRAGRWIREDSLAYPEVGDLGAALNRLVDAGLVERLPDAPADALLRLLTRRELAACFPRVRGRTKADWVADCLARHDDRRIRRVIAARHPWVALAAPERLRACTVLFFGSDESDLSAFVIQDLGVRRYEAYALDERSRPFATRPDLDRYLLSRRLAAWSHRLDDVPALAGAMLRLLWPAARSRTEQRARDRVLNRLGRWHERRGELDAALTCFGRSTGHPARERRARLLHRLGDDSGLAGVLKDMRQDPWGPEEVDFAARFPGRRRSAPARITECRLGGGVPARIERHALALLSANGGRGWHLENALPLGLAGLAFWDVVFAPVAGAFSHPLQDAPQDLFWPDFARVRRGLIDARLAELAAPGAFAAALRSTWQDKQGISNRLVRWGRLSAEALDALLDAAPHDRLLALAERAIRDPAGARTGFPDLLMVYGPGAWELVEVKGPTDSLQPAQRTWLSRLDGLGLPARVLRFTA